MISFKKSILITIVIEIAHCFSGPIMPRITECLAARQEVLEEPAVPSVTSVPTALPSVPGCKGKCAGACIGPRCAGQSLFQKYIPYTYVLVQ